MLVRCAPDDGSSLAVGLNGQLGEVRSRVPTFTGGMVGAWGVDARYDRGNWTFLAEFIQILGTVSPVRYSSGGPSNRITDYLAGLEYTTGPILWRATYNLGIDENPYGRHELMKAGCDITVTDHVNLIVEYIKEDIDNNAGGIELFDAFEFILFWHF